MLYPQVKTYFFSLQTHREVTRQNIQAWMLLSFPCLDSSHKLCSSSSTHTQVPKQALMQALARGYLARCEFRRRVAERKAAEDAALAVIRPWARTAVARLHFLRLRWVFFWRITCQAPSRYHPA